MNPANSLKRGELQAHLERLAESVAEPAGLEIVEVELKGAGRHQLLRITIDKPASAPTQGVTHADCELVSREMSALLDAEDPIANPYELEVTSPGVERKLLKWRDWERFQGQKVKVVLKEPAEGDLKHLSGIISRVTHNGAGATGLITIQLEGPPPSRKKPGARPPDRHKADGPAPEGTQEVTFPFDQVDNANLKFDW